MPPMRKRVGSISDTPSDWREHDLYEPGCSFSRVVTRSQTAFCRIKNTDSDLEMFSNPLKHQPPGHAHVMEIMKGQYGAIPRTIITRSTGQYLTVSEDLINKLEPYKNFDPVAADAGKTEEELEEMAKKLEQLPELSSEDK
ncbi:uncharacterized protein CDAR_186651 [Caerostris darwini]|uniref:Uncharacterized protein n=1 Tax=Caerostris darwini TaxID=1538125 RepID=A0AAV4VUJ9_9ARAC|nr:uncharacterized protein CDAR_186651 [Caerostris darwini]